MKDIVGMELFKMLVLAALFVTSLMDTSEGGRVLGLFPCPGKSHNNMFTVLMQALAAKGHHVTVVGHFPLQKPLPNFRDITLKLDLQSMLNQLGNEDMLDMNDASPFHTNVVTWNFGAIFTNDSFQNPEVQSLIHGNDHFDVIFVSAVFSEAMYGFAHKFDAPIISICPNTGWEISDQQVGTPRNYAYVPNLLLDYSDHMTFKERLMNTVMGMFEKWGGIFYYLPKQQALLEKHFGHLKSLPSIRELEQRIALVMLNSHLSVTYPRPLAPNMVQVGGMHIKPPGKLPEDLQKFLDEAKDGVIYFSMGSILKSSEFPEVQRAALLKVFSKLKQKVLWKWDDDVLPGKPENVKISKWLPQQEILAQPNVRLFMTHGGQFSTLESIHHGVPVVGIPILADQLINIQKAVKLGYGLKVALKDLTEDTLSSALHQVLDNPKYRDAAKRLSAIFRDRPMSALDEAVYWTEYVMRHKGTAHMRSAALDLTWYQYLLLDVLAVVVLVPVTALVLLVFVLKRLARVLCGRKSQVKTVKSTKKIN